MLGFQRSFHTVVLNVATGRWDTLIFTWSPSYPRSPTVIYLTICASVSLTGSRSSFHHIFCCLMSPNGIRLQSSFCMNMILFLSEGSVHQLSLQPVGTREEGSTCECRLCLVFLFACLWLRLSFVLSQTKSRCVFAWVFRFMFCALFSRPSNHRIFLAFTFSLLQRQNGEQNGNLSDKIS